MAEGDQQQQTPPATPPATPPVNPDGTPPAPNAAAGAPAEEMVTISKKELEGIKKSQKDLLSQKDKAVNDNNAQGDFVLQLAKEREIGTFLTDNKDKFSYLTQEDLMFVNDPSELQSTAERLQKRYQDVVQEALLNVQDAKPPILSPEDKAAELTKMRKTPTKKSFGRMLELQQQPNS